MRLFNFAKRFDAAIFNNNILFVKKNMSRAALKKRI